MNDAYVHGYQPRENERQQDQAGTLVELLHADTAYPAGSTVLEAGCGIGAQTVTLAQRSPQARFIAIDLATSSIAEAARRTAAAGLANVGFRQATSSRCPSRPRASITCSSASCSSTSRGRPTRWRRSSAYCDPAARSP